MSLFGEYPCLNMTIPPSYISFTTASIFIPLTLLTVTGNLLVLLAIFVDPYRDLKSPFNYFVANLAVADLLVGLVVDPLGVVYHYSEGLQGKYPASLNYIHVPYFMTSSASVLSLAALTFDRYLAITSPMSYRTRLNPKRAGFVSLGIWVFSVAFSFLYLVTGYLMFSFIFMHTIILFSFFVMLFTYQRIFKVFRTQVEQWDNMNDAKNEDNFAKRQAVRWEQKVTKTFLIMLVFFLGCYLPACICIYITNLCSTCSCVLIHWARDAHFFLILSNSSINPFLYAVRFENFRKAFKKMLQCACLRRRFQSFRLEFVNSSTGESTTSIAPKTSQSE
ncbi:histamine H1 receptor-like isoform X2 [Actinia tenebrosa]|uniref:Histamine H1 receptor-like isoform X2 n=1 Tax=Actinia tenebrosa TaxID=6105 RepID=A0A6P8IGJ8_ACTTE|nr:histamine H1 receptor-like isoform X2 [Actinia tenebrosa]XP_031565864.1 histamine H1 receptor-like isoform X2 [Actinia tenebrosa]XP_031565865.1 histamine H1 receptor-like isoform X2 [Actinia tenebrosa]XP_031565866.1 histamine H1 receptor-like isoform X2 [Actinia tenebrosa]